MAISPIEPAWLRERRKAVYALVVLCVCFFSFWIIFDFALAIHLGYGTGFGDGRNDPMVPKPQGSGFVVDALILTASMAVDIALVCAWGWLLARLDGPSEDDPITPLPKELAESADDQSWFIVKSPLLVKSLTTIAAACLVWLTVCGAAILPVVLYRYGWSR